MGFIRFISRMRRERRGMGGQRFSYEIRLQWLNEIGKDFDEGVLRRFHIRDIFMYGFQINFNFEY